MKVETEYVERKVYVAVDGKRFYDRDKCIAHENDIEKRKNGTRKTCERCNGRGRINYRIEKYFDSPANWGDGEWHETEESDVCPEFHGKGYLELKWS